MSVRVMSIVWDGYPGGGSELLALLALADWSDDDGRCYPSMASIGRKTRLSEKQARRVVHSLEEAGFLRVTGGQTGGGMSRRYQIALDRLTPPAGGRAPTDGRAPADVPNPSRPREGTPPTHGRRTISEPSKNRQGEGDMPPVSSKAADLCPYREIVDLYHEAMPDNPRCKVLSKSRKAAIKARWTEAAKLTCKPFGYGNRHDGLKAWRAFFEVCADSDFLTGRAPATNGRPPFVADIDFLMSPNGFARTLENKYHRTAEPGASRPTPAPSAQDALFRGCI